MNNSFLSTVNGFDFLLIAIITFLVVFLWTNAVESDKFRNDAEFWRKAEAVAQSDLEIRVEQVLELEDEYNRLSNNFVRLSSRAHNTAIERDMALEFLDKRCYCSKRYSNIVCPWHEFQREASKDPWWTPEPRKANSQDLARWQALSQDPWSSPEPLRCDFCAGIYPVGTSCNCGLD